MRDRPVEAGAAEVGGECEWADTAVGARAGAFLALMGEGAEGAEAVALDDGVNEREMGVAKVGRFIAKVVVNVLNGTRTLMRLPTLLDFKSRVDITGLPRVMAAASNRTVCAMRLACTRGNGLDPAQAAGWSAFLAKLLGNNRMAMLELPPQPSDGLGWVLYVVPTSDPTSATMQDAVGASRWKELSKGGMLPKEGLGAWGVLLGSPAYGAKP